MVMLKLLLMRTVIGLFMHPFHVSVCDIHYNESNKSLEITYRIFLDDLEEALRVFGDNPKLDVMKESDQEEVHRLLHDYFAKKFAVSVNGALRPHRYLGEEREEDVMYCYIEIENVAKLERIEVENTLLLETFGDQMNLVHIKAFGNTKSLRLRNNHEVGEIKY